MHFAPQRGRICVKCALEQHFAVWWIWFTSWLGTSKRCNIMPNVFLLHLPLNCHFLTAQTSWAFRMCFRCLGISLSTVEHGNRNLCYISCSSALCTSGHCLNGANPNFHQISLGREKPPPIVNLLLAFQHSSDHFWARNRIHHHNKLWRQANCMHSRSIAWVSCYTIIIKAGHCNQCTAVQGNVYKMFNGNLGHLACLPRTLCNRNRFPQIAWWTRHFTSKEYTQIFLKLWKLYRRLLTHKRIMLGKYKAYGTLIGYFNLIIKLSRNAKSCAMNIIVMSLLWQPQGSQEWSELMDHDWMMHPPPGYWNRNCFVKTSVKVNYFGALQRFSVPFFKV